MIRAGKTLAGICVLSILAGMSLTGCGRRADAGTSTTVTETGNAQVAEPNTQTTEMETEAATETANEVQTEPVTEPESLVTLEGYIQEIDGKIVVLADAQGGLYQLDTEEAGIKNVQGASVPVEKLQVGQAVDVVFNGITMRNHPATIPMVTSFTIVEDRKDPYGAYREILKSVWEANPEMNTGIELVALDLTDVKNLTTDQWGIISYYMRQLCQCEVRLATEEELEEEGIIDRESEKFVDGNGMLIVLDDQKERDNTISFEAEKWLSDRQEVEFDYGTARYENGTWTVQL